MKTFVIAGTGASQPVAERVYAPLANALDAEVISLKRIGLSHVSQSVGRVNGVVSNHHWKTWKAEGRERVTLVGHSQGGMVALLSALSGFNVDRVVTIGAPLRGSRWAPTWAPFSAARCMAVGSRLCRQLEDDWNQSFRAGVIPRMLNVVGTKDVLVHQEHAYLPGADVQIFDEGHLSLIYSENVITAIDDWLEDSLNERAA